MLLELRSRLSNFTVDFLLIPFYYFNLMMGNQLHSKKIIK